MKYLFIFTLAFMLSGCFEEEKHTSECFDIIQSKDDLRPIMFNRCNGESWMLVKTQLRERSNEQKELYTYRWNPITKSDGEPNLSPMY